ncbi:MAG: CHAT domain-containing protein [Bacteroidetes bacterium CHB5]|nr:CHAT domain-containing protein [Bacteroidetes bacterium CHB5]
MARLTLSLIILFLAWSVALAQKQGVMDQLNQLLADSRFDAVIALADATPGNTPLLNLEVQNKKVEALVRLGKLDEADNLLETLLTKAKETKNAGKQVAMLQTTKGFLQLNRGRIDLAIEELEAAIQKFDTDNQSRSLEMADALAHLGNVYRTSAKWSQAEEHLLRALAIRQEKLPADHELIAATYNDLGLSYITDNIDKSYQYYTMALTMYEKLHGKEHPKIAIANTNLGYLNQIDKQYGDAINYYNTALAIWEKIYPQPHPNKALVMMNLGQTYSSMGNSATALEFYENALTMYQTAYGKKHPDVTYVLNLIGNEKLAQKKYEEAMQNYQKAIIANLPDFNSEEIEANPTRFNFYNGAQLLNSLMYKAQALETRHLSKTLKIKDLQLALSTLQTSDTLIDKMRQQTTYESDKIALGAVANEIYAAGVRVSHLLSDVSFLHRTHYRELSFYFAEKSKAAVLQEAISDSNAKSFANIPSDLLEEEKSLKSALALVNQKLAQKPTEDEEKYLRETAFELNQAYNDFVAQLERQFPDYFNLKFNSAAPTITQLQNLLDSKTAIISYFIDEGNAPRLYTFLITSKRYEVKDQPLPGDYDKYLSGFRNSMFFSNANVFTVSARNLYRLLIPAGIPSGIHNLVFLPAGRMSVIPFEALLTQPVKEQATFHQLPYLINKFNIRYELSAGLLLQKSQGEKKTGIASAQLMAPVQFPVKDNLSPLPGTETEVKQIQELLQGKQITCNILINQEANETSIKSESLRNYDLIHFATHGIVDEDNPDLSRIFLQNDSEAEDGNLFSGEIYNLHLNANLVTLSACQTGLGKISKGEGVIGLSRALVYAGAKNLVVSFWSVADESTSQLMTTFYQHLITTKETTFAEALRGAKLKMIRQQKYASPFYWAPFVLIGY